MSEYLQTAVIDGFKIKDLYRIKAVYNEETGQWIRDKQCNLDGTDIYIECASGDMIYDISPSKRMMQAYISSIGRGRNILKAIYSSVLGRDISKLEVIKKTQAEDGSVKETQVFDIEALIKELNDSNYIANVFENDEEVQFDFHISNIKHIAELMKAKKPMANTSPFNNKYLPGHKIAIEQKKLDEARFVKYEMPKGYWDEIKKVLPKIAKAKGKTIDKALEECYKEFGKQIKVRLLAEADSKNYKTNHYIHFIGKWEEFEKFILAYPTL